MTSEIRKPVVLGILLGCFLALVLSPPIASASGSVAILWTKLVNGSLALYRSDYRSLSTPRILYGHNVGYLCVVPSPEGDQIAAQIVPSGPPAVYFVCSPGLRRAIRISTDEGYRFLSEWSRDGSGLLIGLSSTEVNPDGVYVGVYAVGSANKRTLVSRPATGRLLPPSYARYSRDRTRLLILSDQWLQVVDAESQKNLLFLQYDSQEIRSSPVWLDDDTFVFSCRDSIWRGSISRGKAGPWILRNSIKSLVYASKDNQLFALAETPDKQNGLFLAIDPKTGQYRRIALPGLESVLELFGVTSDGNLALVLARDPKHVSPSSGKPSTYGIWLVDLHAGEHKLVAEGSIEAALIESTQAK